MTKYILSYFPFPARAEPTRLAFAIGGIAFTNKSVEFSEFKELKPTLPLGQLPCLEIEDDSGNKKALSQSDAILRFVGKLSNLYPSDPVKAMEVDMVIDTVEEAVKFLSMTVGGPQRLFISDNPWSNEEKLEIRKKLMEPEKMNNVAYYLGALESFLEANKTGWFVGDKPTIADLRAHHLVGWLQGGVLDGIPTTCMEAYPMLVALRAKVEEIPQVVAWRAKYGTKYATFDYVPEN